MKTLLIDDHLLYREGVTRLLRRHPDFNVVGESGTLREAYEMARQLRPELCFIDYSLLCGSGLEAARRLMAAFPGLKVVCISACDEKNIFIPMNSTGTKGYRLRSMPVYRLLPVLREQRSPTAAIAPYLSRCTADDGVLAGSSGCQSFSIEQVLSDRELEILNALTTGATNIEIAAQFNISRHTVKNHVHSILGKLNLNNRREAARLAAGGVIYQM